MSNLKHFDGPTFDTDVLQSGLPVLVDFYADWCGPCRAMEPVVEQLASDLDSTVTVGKLDTDANQEIAIRYGVMSIPTLGFFRDGKLVDRLIGYPGPSRVRSWVSEHIGAPVA
jgi:thioredoxin 1